MAEDIDLGKISLTPKGDWSTDAVVEYNDIWRYNKGKFLALKDSQGIVPIDDSEYWYKLSSEGDSAYELAVKNGYVGTEETWVESLSKPAKDAASQAVIAIAAIDKKISDAVADIEDDITVAVVGEKTSSVFDLSYIPANVLTIVNRRMLYGGKKNLARKLVSDSDFIMWQISDIHGDPTGIAKAVELAKGSGDCIVLLGDTLFKPSIESAIFSSTKPCLCIVGNHDAVDLEYTNVPATRDFVTRFQGINNVVETGMPYFYKDFPSKLIRVIGLYEYDYETCGTPINSNYGVVYSQTQIDWLIATLANAPKDYHIILLHHQPVGVTRVSHFDRFISSNAPLFYEFESNIDDTADITPAIIEAFRTGVNLNAKVFSNGGNGTVIVTTSFSEPSNKFIAHFAGHTHWDVVEYLPKYPAQLQVVIDQSCSGDDDDHYRYSDLPKRAGTDYAYVINRVAVDVLDKTLTIDRFGSKYTTDGRTRDFITYPFTPDPSDIILTLTPNTILAFINTTIQLVADINGYPTSAVVYASSDETVATVDSNGLVTTTNKVGVAIITAYNSTYNITGSCAIQTRAHELTLGNTSINMYVNTTYQILAYLDGVLVNSNLIYESSDETVATVDSSGLVTTTGKAGNAVISVTEATYNIARTLSLVNSANNLSVEHPNLNLYIGQTQQILAYFNGEPITDGLTYTVSNEAVLSVSNTGLITALANGECTITIVDLIHGLQATISTVVSNVLSVNAITATVKAGNTWQILVYFNGSLLSTGLTFSTADETIATVSNSGLVSSAINNGVVYITVTDTNTNLSVQVSITNNNVLTLDKSTIAIENASTASLSAFINGIPTNDVVYESSNEAIGTVSSTGLITTTTVVGVFDVIVRHTLYNISATVNCTNKAVTPLTAFINRVNADGGTFLYTDLNARYEQDTALLGGVSPRLAYYAYKNDANGNLTKLYSVDSAYDCSGISTSDPNITDSPTRGLSNLQITNNAIKPIDTALYGSIIIDGKLNSLPITRFYYAGNLVAKSDKTGVFAGNINPLYDPLGAGNSTVMFYKSGIIHFERCTGSAQTMSSVVKGYPVTGTLQTVYAEFEQSETYVTNCKINGTIMQSTDPEDYWTVGNPYSFITIRDGFDRVLAG